MYNFCCVPVSEYCNFCAIIFSRGAKSEELRSGYLVRYLANSHKIFKRLAMALTRLHLCAG